MHLIHYIFITVTLVQAALLSPSYSTDFKEGDYSECIKHDHPLPGHNLEGSYELCYNYFSNRYDASGEETEKCTYALALAETLLKPLSKEAYGPDGKKFQDVIGYLDAFLEVANDWPLSEYRDLLNKYERHSIIYKTRLAIRVNQEFPGKVLADDFIKLYGLLSKIQSPKHTRTIQLYKAHLIVFNGVKLDMMSEEEVLQHASQLISSTYHITSPSRESLCQALRNKQKVHLDQTIYSKPSLITKKEQAHRDKILGAISSGVSDIHLLLPTLKAQGPVPTLTDQQAAPTEECDPKTPKKKRKQIVIDEDEEDLTADTSDPQPQRQPESQLEKVSEAGVEDVLKDTEEVRIHTKRSRLVNNDEGDTRKKVKEYIKAQWKEEGHDPTPQEIRSALGLPQYDPKDKASKLKWSLRKKFPKLAQATDNPFLSPSQQPGATIDDIADQNTALNLLPGLVEVSDNAFTHPSAQQPVSPDGMNLRTPKRKIKKILTEDEDDTVASTPDSQSPQLLEPQPQKVCETNNYKPYNCEEVAEYLLSKGKEGLDPTAQEIVETLNYSADKETRTTITSYKSFWKKRNPNVMPPKSLPPIGLYILSKWEKEKHDPTPDEIIKHLNWDNNKESRRKIRSYKYSLKQRYSQLVPSKISSTECMIEFILGVKTPWKDFKELYPVFNKDYPSVVKLKYFRDHASIIRNILALKGMISDSSKRRDQTSSFASVIEYIEQNPSGSFEQFYLINSKVTQKYFLEIKSAYEIVNDYILKNKKSN